ncbi:MAG: YfhO family protein [Acidobacteria bacterium]|nr:YfhO family protein [Acidobacteriota bacterium]
MAEAGDVTAERRNDFLAMALLSLIVTVLYADVLFLGANFFTRDLTIYHYPMKWVVRELILGGDFPYWNRLYSAGQPLAANPAYEVFYPLQWLTLLPDYNFGFRLHIVAHVFIAVIGAYRFLRSLELGAPASLAGATAFGLCGPYVSTVNLLPFLFSVSWAPWIALYARRWLLARRARDFAAAGLVLGMQAIVCEPVTLLQTWGVIVLYAIGAGWKQGVLRGAMRGVARSIGLVATGIAVAAVQFLPAIDHAYDSVRGRGFELWVASRWSVAPVRLIEEIFPNVFGSSEGLGRLYWGQFRFGMEAGGPFLYSIYLSVAIVALVVAGMWGRVAGRGLTALVAVPSIVLSFGAHTPLLALMHGAGLLPSVRYPEKFMLVASFALLTYAAIVFDAIVKGNSALARRGAWLCAASGVVAAVVFILCFQPGYPEWFMEFWRRTDRSAALIARTQWFVSAIRSIAFAFAFAALARDTGRKAIALFVLFLVADLAPLGNQINPRIDRSFFDTPPPLLAKLDMRGTRLAHVAALQLGSNEQKAYFKSYRTYWTLRNGLWPYSPALWGVPTCLEYDVDETQLTATRDVIELADVLSKRGITDWIPIVGAWCASGPVLTYRHPAAELKRIGDRWDEIEPVTVDPFVRYPRYFFASEVVAAADNTVLADLLVARPRSPRTAFVREGAWRAGNGRVVAAQESASRTLVDVDAGEDAFLVLASTWHKYWRATVDGRQVEIVPTNVAFQGIAIPKGVHRVELRYSNPLIAVGGFLSLMALATLAVVAIRGNGRAVGVGANE